MRMAWVIVVSVTCGRSDQRGLGVFQSQQPALGGESLAAGVAAQMAGGNNAVAGDDQRDRVGAVGLANRAGAAAGDGSDLLVAAGLAIGNVAQRLPDAAA